MNVEQNAVVTETELTAVELELVVGGTEQEKQNFGQNVAGSIAAPFQALGSGLSKGK